MAERIVVLMGGDSTEREVSLSSGRRVADALQRAGYLVIAMDVLFYAQSPPKPSPEGVRTVVGLHNLISALQDLRPAVVFIALHGSPGEDGKVQAVLDLLRIPYTGSGVLASALALDKRLTKRLLAAEGIPVAPDVVCYHHDDLSQIERQIDARIGYPLIVKPNTQGSTIGVKRVYDRVDLQDALHEAFAYDECVLVEPLIQGVELTVPVVGNRRAVALPMIEIVPASGFYDYTAKYTPGATDEIIPARVPSEVHRQCSDYALRAHQHLGCRGMSRSDFMWDGKQAILLEVNTIPGMTPTSLLPRAAEAYGWSFEQLVVTLVKLAQQEEVL